MVTLGNTSQITKVWGYMSAAHTWIFISNNTKPQKCVLPQISFSYSEFQIWLQQNTVQSQKIIISHNPIESFKNIWNKTSIFKLQF